MKNILSSLGIAFPILLLCSCQKEINWGESDTDNIVDTLLAKYIELDTTLPSGQDTTNVYTFTYDNLKRVQRIRQVKNFAASMVTYYVTTDFFYNGAETLPYKVVELNQEDVAYVDTTFYKYNNGFVSLDSSLNYVVSSHRWLYTNVIAFSVTGNNVFVRIKDIFRFSTYEDSATLTITRQNGNIIMQQDPNNTITENIQMTYDNKVNPFYRGDIHYPIYYEHLFNSFNAQKNNPLEQSFSIGSSTSRIKYQYTYRSDGYPLTVTKTDLTYSSQSRKGIFIYTR